MSPVKPYAVVYLKTGPDTLAEDENGNVAAFVVVSIDGEQAVIRWADDEVEIAVAVADLVPVT